MTLPKTWISPTSLLPKLMSLESWPPTNEAVPCTERTAAVDVRRLPPVTSSAPATVGLPCTVTVRVSVDLAIRRFPICGEPLIVAKLEPSKTRNPGPETSPDSVAEPPTRSSLAFGRVTVAS